MKAPSHPIALAAFKKALKSASKGPAPKPEYNSRNADKFVIRGYEEIFVELTAIGRHQGRSTNSEVVAGILESLAEIKRSVAEINIIKTKLGEDVAGRVLAEIPEFDIEKCKTPREYNVRLPPSIRDTVRKDVEKAVEHEDGGAKTMNAWMLNALVDWIRLQRQHYALLTAAIIMDQTLLIETR